MDKYVEYVMQLNIRYVYVATCTFHVVLFSSTVGCGNEYRSSLMVSICVPLCFKFNYCLLCEMSGFLNG